mmetsp:Transcript_61841/g.182595  ORF Transcript_61841/g.182595 Transcript_61841/m.182595 type:complete len:570 (-) Transcript_61841:600-2309(-)
MTDIIQERQYSVELPHTAQSDRGPIHRASLASSPQLAYEGCYTLYEALRRGRDVSPLGPCLGFRAVSTSGYATPFVYSSYTECVARVNALAAGLDAMELCPKTDDDLVLLGIYMKNCMEWTLSEHSIYCLGGATVPLYDTLGPTTVEFVLNQTNMPCVVCTRAELKHLCEAKQTGSCHSFRTAILVDGVIPEAAKMAKAAGLDVVSFAKVEAVGAQIVTKRPGHKHSPPSGKDIATFCYTSGTTGNPKGALITHENFLSAVAGMQGGLKAHPFDRHLSYLPLPHIFERVVQAQMLHAGASIGFFRGDPTLLIEDIQACRPTVLPVAPRVLNKVHDKVVAGISAAGGMKKKIFDSALAAKAEGLQRGHLTHPLYDRLIFNKLKKALGMDHIRFMVSGSAPLSNKVMTFFRCMLGVPVVEGYGQTEGTAAATIGAQDDIATVGHVGGPVDCCEVVLVDVPEMGYLHTDTSHQGLACRGRGEIWIRGPHVFKGYYKDEAKTKEAINDEGWLMSGDVGLWTLEGTLAIIDRKKNIFKLAQGGKQNAMFVLRIHCRCPLPSLHNISSFFRICCC